MPKVKSPREKFNDMRLSLNELYADRTHGEPNTTKNVRSVTERKTLGHNNRLILDSKDRIWYLPEVVDRDGFLRSHIDYPLQLHFGDDGEVTKAVVLHPYHDPNIPVDDATAALGQALGQSPVNAGLNEPIDE